MSAPRDGMTITLDGAPVALPTVKRSGFSMGDAASSRYTIVSAETDPSGLSLAIHVPDKTAGVYACNDDAITRVLLTGDGIYAAGRTGTGESSGSCSIDVTAYGAPGEAIEGRFTATMKKVTGGSKLPAERRLTGEFRVVRQDF